MRRFFLFLFLAFTLPSYGAQWTVHDGARTRLIDAGNDGQTRLIGWQVDLEEGWKTYWRSPGEAGLPPRFDFSNSDNLASADIRFPLPDRFDFFGIESFGYGKELLLPIQVEAEDPTKPVHLRAHVDFMVCSDICIPHQARYEMVLDPQAGNADAASLIHTALTQVPGPSTDISPLRLTNAKVRGPAGRQRLSVEIAADFDLVQPDLFVELDPAFGLSAPRFALLGGGRQGRFVLEVDGGPEDLDLKGRTITLTLFDQGPDGRLAVEKTLTLP